MTKTKRVAAMMMAAAMGTSMIGVIPAAAEEERETLKLALTQSSMVTDYENNYFTKYLEDKLNTDGLLYLGNEITETPQSLKSLGEESDSVTVWGRAYRCRA